MATSAQIGHSSGVLSGACITDGYLIWSTTVPDKGRKEEQKESCQRRPLRFGLTLLGNSWSIILRSKVSHEAFQLIISTIDSNQPIRGIGPLILRGPRERAAGRGRQPQPIVPDFRTQEYLERHNLQRAGHQEQQNMARVSKVSWPDIPNEGNSIQNQVIENQPVE